MSSSEEDLTPPELKKAAEGVTAELLPQKSKIRYEAQFNTFKKWLEQKGAQTFSENVMIAYFTELVQNNKKSLWAIYSMLKTCIKVYHNIDISKYTKLITYLKRKTYNYKPKKSKIFDEEQISEFLQQAPDNAFLSMKVALILGVSGACRREELYKMKIKNIQLKDNIFLITIPDTKTNIVRSFVVSNELWVNIIKKYLTIRNKVINQDKFFVRYFNGKCYNAPVGINTIGSMPCKIAEFLKIENPKDFTGHCFRRSSATLLVNRGGDLLMLKKHGGWKSSTVAEGYVEESFKRKVDMATLITGSSSSKKMRAESNVSSSLPSASTVTAVPSLPPGTSYVEIETI